MAAVRGQRQQWSTLCSNFVSLDATSVALYCEVCLAGVPEHVPAGVPPVPPVPPKVLVLLPCVPFSNGYESL